MIRKSTALGLSTALIIGAVPAHALTANQLWSDWESFTAQNGANLTAQSIDQNGAETLIKGIKLESPDDDGTLQVSTLKMVENLDGSLTLHPGQISFTAPETLFEESASTLDVTHDGLELTILDITDGFGYDVRADDLSVSGSIGNPRVDSEQPLFDGVFRLEDFAMHFEQVQDAGSMTLESANFGMDYTIGENSAFEINAEVASSTKDVFFEVDYVIPNGIDFSELDSGPQVLVDALQRGAFIEMLWRNGYATITERLTLEETDTEIFLTIEQQPSAYFTFRFDKNALTLTSDQGKTDVGVLVAGLPAPFNVSLDRAFIGMNVPLWTQGVEADYGFDFNIENLALSEEGWALIDPANIFEHDPLSLDIDIGGQAISNVYNSVEGGVPFLPTTFEIDTLMLELLGARFSGSGRFENDSATLTTQTPFEGVAGTAAAELTGANKLIDTLVSAGLITPQQAGSARLMLAIAGIPSAQEDDKLTTEIEVQKGPSLLVNGQRFF